jgi:hypothetical protein
MRIPWVTASFPVKPGGIDRAPALQEPSREPERQRGLWSFLTWSFFLSQVMVDKPFFGQGAYAGQEDNDHALANETSEANTTFGDLPKAGAGIAALPADGAEDFDVNSNHSSHLSRSVLLLDTQPVASALGRKPIPSADDSEASGGGGGGGGSGGRTATLRSESPRSTSLDHDATSTADASSSQGTLVASSTPPDPDLSPLSIGFDDGVASSASELPGLSAGQIAPVVADIDTPQTASALQVHSPAGEFLFVGTDLTMPPILTHDTGIPEPGQTAGLTIQGHLIDILGFDVSLSQDGTFVGADIDLAQVSPADLGGANLLAIHASAGGLTVSVDSAEEISHIQSALADITGLQLFGDSSDLTAQLINMLASASATLTKTTDVLTAPLDVAPPVAEIISNPQAIGALGPSGDIASSAGVAQTLAHNAVDAGADRLLAGDNSAAGIPIVAPDILAPFLSGNNSAAGIPIVAPDILAPLLSGNDSAAGIPIVAPDILAPLLSGNDSAAGIPNVAPDILEPLLPGSDSAAGPTATIALDPLTDPSADDVSFESAPAAGPVAFNLQAVGELQQSGDIASGDAITLPAQTSTQTDELFTSDNRYTDYHVTLQTQNPNSSNPHNTDTSDLEVSPSATDAPHHSGTSPHETSPHNTIEATTPAPTIDATIQQASDSIVPTSTTIPHHTLH